MSDHGDAIDFNRLRRLCSRHRWMWILFFVTMVTFVVGVVGGLATAESPVTFFQLAYHAGFTLVAVSIILSFPFGRQACPRCGKPFYVAEGVRGFFCRVNLLNRVCVHCGLSLDETRREGHNAAEPQRAADAASHDDGREDGQE